MKFMDLHILEKLKKIYSFTIRNIIQIALSGRLWLTFCVVIAVILYCRKYFISEYVLYNITFYKIDYCIFAIIIILTAAFSYNVFSYICNIKSVEKKSLSDILLTCIFIILLFIHFHYTSFTTYFQEL